MKPLVSVIIPVYKTEEYLEECMASVLAQTYEDLEIILVDDGSPDNAPAMCDAYGKGDSRVRVIHKENGGLSDARNAGKAIATGQYLTFLDSDDILAPETVAYMVDVAEKEKAQVVKIGVIRKYAPEECVTRLKDHTLISGRQALSRIFWDNSQIITICGKLFDAALFRDLDFPVGLYYEDEYTTPRIYCRAERVALSDSELYFYMQRDNESILRGALNEKRIRDSLFVTEDRIRFLREQGMGDLAKKAVADHWLKLKKLEAAAEKQPELAAVCEDVRQQKKNFERENWFTLAPVRLKQWLYRLVKG